MLVITIKRFIVIAIITYVIIMSSGGVVCVAMATQKMLNVKKLKWRRLKPAAVYFQLGMQVHSYKLIPRTTLVLVVFNKESKSNLFITGIDKLNFYDCLYTFT